MRFIAAILGITLSLIPATLSAQQSTSGWIWWIHTSEEPNEPPTTGPRPSAIERWEPKDGYETISECRAAGEAYIDGLSEALPATDIEINRLGRMVAMMFIKNTNGITTVYTYSAVCFPGTFDPRPRPASSS